MCLGGRLAGRDEAVRFPCGLVQQTFVFVRPLGGQGKQQLLEWARLDPIGCDIGSDGVFWPSGGWVS